MDHKPDERVRQLQMIIDNENRIISIWTLTLEKLRNVVISSSSNEDDYILIENNPKFEKPIGELLFSFINADFKTESGFNCYIKVWGLAGLLKVNEEYDNPNLDHFNYNGIEAKNIIHSFYTLTKSALVNAQKDFKEVIDLCINDNKEPYLEGLTPSQRYFAGLLANVISNLDIYSKPYYVYFKPRTEKTIHIKGNYSIESICNSIKTESLIIETTYYSQNIITFAYIEFFNLLNNFTISKCTNCNKYFVPKTKINEIYCEDCRHTGYINKVKNNEFLKAYNTAYKTKHAQMTRQTLGKSKETHEKYKKALKKWREEAIIKRLLIQEEQISEIEFRNFLNSNLEV
ncbi:DUF6076 domain-containing protein [Clostridium estertheticum]|uniref:DUF6076 domain-containing protein n=1 Tax=Clostridium estertheticum TaxID=238834 RepID=UPI001C0AFBFC|nr:DUF6076 domain-containing protein [Clostridium estertheticum]MBU3173696.1 hypothetical protein [Clostridium estertheticum]